MTTGRFRRRGCALAIGALVLLVGCNGSDDAASETTPEPPGSPPTSPTTGATPTSGPTTPSTATPTSDPAETTDQPAALTTIDTAPFATRDTTPPSRSVPGEAAVDWTAIVTDLLQQQFELPMDPSFERIDDLCTEVSSCRETWTTTVETLVGNDLRIEGGVPYELVSVEFQDTVDSVPLDEALAVTLIVRQNVTEQGEVNLVDAAGNVVEPVAADPSLEPGQRISRPMIVGRDTLASPWKLVARGAIS